MGVTERIAGLFERPAVSRSVYRCTDCGVEGDAGDSCAECGGELEPVDEPVHYVYPEPY